MMRTSRRICNRANRSTARDLALSQIPEVRDRVQQGFELQSRCLRRCCGIATFSLADEGFWGQVGHSQLPGMRPPWVDDSLFPFESRFVELGDHVVHYVDEGSGPSCSCSTESNLGQVISSLRGHFRSIALDYPGFGLSVAGPGYSYLPADHAAVTGAFVERLGLSEVTLVVQDWGGPIGLHVAEQRPEVFRGLVIGNTFGCRSTATCTSRSSRT